MPQEDASDTAIHADLWNGYGEAAAIAETSDVLREHCNETGRDFASIRRSVTMDIVIRDRVEDAEATFHQIEDAQGLHGPLDSVDVESGLNAAGPPEIVADYLRSFKAIGIGEVMWIFRSPFDLETIERLPAVRVALAS